MRFTKQIKGVSVGIVILILYVVLFSYYMGDVRKSKETDVYERLTEVAMQSAEVTKIKVDSNTHVLEAISNIIGNEYKGDFTPFLSYLVDEVSRNEFKRMGIISPDGTARLTDGYIYDFSDRDYFIKALNGQATVSDMIIDKVDGGKIIVSAVPIISDGNIIGVLFATNTVDVLSSKLELPTYQGYGYTYIIKSNGDSIIQPHNKNKMVEFDNLFTLMSSSDAFIRTNELNNFKDNLQNGNGGVIIYSVNNVHEYMSYEPVGINDWYSCTVVPESIISKRANKTIAFTLILELITVALFGLLILYIVYLQSKKKRELETYAYRDPLTGYPNWNKLKLDAIKMLSDDDKPSYIMVTMDVDGFKLINDIFGHIRGSELLRNIADNINSIIEPDELFCRNSADTFNLFLKYTNKDHIIERIKNLNAHIVHANICFNLKLSFGLYIVNNKDFSLEIMSDRANLAKKDVKGRIDKMYAFYDDYQREQLLLTSQIENDMDKALDNHEFKVYLQPKIEFSTCKLKGAEALVRWEHPEKGLIAPYMFIPLFEKNGFITKLDMYMFENVCQLIKKWNEQNKEISDITISVNLSRIHLGNPNLVKDLIKIVKANHIESRQIEIELTESAVFGNANQLIEMMGELKAVGFKISIDDFGSGYSSLNLLKDLPADILKIDKAFLSEATNSGRGKTIVKNIVSMAKDLGLLTVAEGVETKDQVDFLTEIGCDIAQGYFYAKPMPIKDFEIMASKK